MKLTIRIGAAYDEVIIDGHTFDRSKLDKHQRRAMSSLIVETLFPKQHNNRRPRRRNRNAS